MKRTRVIPIKNIQKGSKVVLYGAGKTGTLFWEQNEFLDWCNICLVVDTNYLKVKGFPTQVFAPEEIYKLEYIDYILIAVVSETERKDIRRRLIDDGISEEKIIEELECYYENDSFEGNVYNGIDSNISEDILNIHIEFSGVMGDCIICLKFYQELIELVPKSRIDIFNSFLNLNILESIMYGQKNLRHITQQELLEEEYEQYDLIIKLWREPCLVWMRLNKVQDICPELARRMLLLNEYQKRDYANIPTYRYANRIILDRAKLCGCNRYTMMSANGIFEIVDQYVELHINSKYEKEFKSLKIDKPYITFNYGANMKGLRGKCQVKMWPYEYHIKLNKMLKVRFPNIEVIQLGGAEVERVLGADRYILGKHLDVTKQVLKNAICHFDCEGGLVHMATQLGTKCFVVFGPTPAWFFGYNRNVNIVPKICGECQELIKDWYTRCYKYDRPECMYSITPEYVFSLMEEYLAEQGY